MILMHFGAHESNVMPHAGDLIYLTPSMVSYKQLQTAFGRSFWQKLLLRSPACQPSANYDTLEHILDKAKICSSLI